MKILIHNMSFYKQLSDFIELFRTMVMNPKDLLINHQVHGPLSNGPFSNNCLT
jgi:hypothetical protein